MRTRKVTVGAHCVWHLGALPGEGWRHYSEREVADIAARLGLVL